MRAAWGRVLVARWFRRVAQSTLCFRGGHKPMSVRASAVLTSVLAVFSVIFVLLLVFFSLQSAIVELNCRQLLHIPT